MMETVIVMPILLLLVFMIIQFAHIWIARQLVVYAAYCGARSLLVISPDDTDPTPREAVQTAAEIALSWVCLADSPGKAGESRLGVPGWGEIPGSGSKCRRVNAEVLSDGNDDARPYAAVRVTFKFPLLIPGMAVNAILGNQVNGNREGKRPATDGKADFYRDLATMADKPVADEDGWPFITMTETCVLPMPYSTRNFPKGGYSGTTYCKCKAGGGS